MIPQLAPFCAPGEECPLGKVTRIGLGPREAESKLVQRPVIALDYVLKLGSSPITTRCWRDRQVYIPFLGKTWVTIRRLNWLANFHPVGFLSPSIEQLRCQLLYPRIPVEKH